MLIFLDTETTGLDESDKICSIGIITEDEKSVKTYYNLIKSDKKITSEASSVHHITNEMIKQSPTFKESEICKILSKYNSTDNTLIAHNIAFDMKMLQREGFIWRGGIIDTLRCTRHLIPECDKFSLQYLRYELKLYRDEKSDLDIDICAHHALSDALHVKLLYNYLLQMSSFNTLEELSVQDVLISKFSFGKYKGHFIEEIAISDAGYLRWMLNMSDLDDDLRYSIEYYLSEGMDFA
jgi:DNA polymerase-3 subunit epsilon/exodeoxyribonuclease X